MEQILLTDEEIIEIEKPIARKHGFEHGGYSEYGWECAHAQIKAQLGEVVGMGLQFHIADREMLEEVGEWAECQDVGVFIYFTKEQWQGILKEIK